ncbi:uncharacterized protein BO88DRAFT_210088 [Aspergillus vadensis CBS 113365]|uniref:Uncharacterized protein n=1 Tax=Aspergillus vadensis (strain CBS 113365 / IMI 142717 / IBT 24658) TaxID=1448311 RepID=A0A319BI31_ASPVC|nr:hypothetical protein BO88DRAFT_210088 [Aspergillus vadensis CBS 113365]PYH72297.1 hypothetical protein BO88DRAFT_210088 [Aspergillus vadensis CBS 113365]
MTFVHLFLGDVNNIRTQSNNNLSSSSIGSSCPRFFPILHSLFQCMQQLLWQLNTGGSPVGRGRSPQCSCQFGRHGTHSLLSSFATPFLALLLFPLGASLLLLSHIERTRFIYFISGYYSSLSSPLVSQSYLSSHNNLPFHLEPEGTSNIRQGALYLVLCLTTISTFLRLGVVNFAFGINNMPGDRESRFCRFCSRPGHEDTQCNFLTLCRGLYELVR